jgi:hypothetical protein
MMMSTPSVPLPAAPIMQDTDQFSSSNGFASFVT